MSGGRAAAGLAALGLAAGLLLAGCGDRGYGSLQRGDRLLAAGDVEAALAEYRLARRQRGDTPEVMARMAHAHARRGEVEAAVRAYDDLLERDSSWRYQAALDLTAAAREALDRQGRDRMARTLEPLLGLGVELVPRDLRLELARHQVERQAFDLALPLLLSVLDEEEPDPGTGVHYLAARSYQELGACRQALPHFERYLQDEGGGSTGRGGALWHYGSCLYEVAQADWRAGRAEEALERVQRLVDLGSPRTLMDRAHFLRGELLADAGRGEEALEAFQRVLRLNPNRTGPLARSAQERVRQIRYTEPASPDSVSPDTTSPVPDRSR